MNPVNDCFFNMQRDATAKSLKSNWLFSISATAFFCLYFIPTLERSLSVLIAVLVWIYISIRSSSMLEIIKKDPVGIKAISIPTTLGICWFGQAHFYMRYSSASKIQVLESTFPNLDFALKAIGSIGLIAALYFVYCCVSFFWRKMTRIFTDNGLLQDMSPVEKIIYSVLISISFVLVITSFVQTRAFYGCSAYDIIYTCDSPALIRDSACLNLMHGENDIRQPLFAVFAAPFVGVPYLLGRLIGASEAVQAILFNAVQIPMMYFANFMLAKTMRLHPVKRLCFMLLSFCTYTNLLFTLTLEQYIVAYFWLTLCIYQICENAHPDRIVLFGAGGTLLTGLILLPSVSEKSPFGNLKAWLLDMIKYGFTFIALMLAFCRFEVVLNLSSRISLLSGFTGKGISFSERMYQYTAFVGDCFLAPNAGINDTAADPISWQLEQATGISFAGVLIFILCLVSIWLNRDKKISLLAGSWIAFSVVVLLVLGWGTQENGLILYALYFGWAFFVLLFQLIEKIGNMMKMNFFVPAVTAACIAALSAINIPAIAELIRFAALYYPA